jgi:hypothetical protein
MRCSTILRFRIAISRKTAIHRCFNGGNGRHWRAPRRSKEDVRYASHGCLKRNKLTGDRRAGESLPAGVRLSDGMDSP